MDYFIKLGVSSSLPVHVIHLYFSLVCLSGISVSGFIMRFNKIIHFYVYDVTYFEC